MDRYAPLVHRIMNCPPAVTGESTRVSAASFSIISILLYLKTGASACSGTQCPPGMYGPTGEEGRLKYKNGKCSTWIDLWPDYLQMLCGGAALVLMVTMMWRAAESSS